jgi:hypothetical protein
MAPCQADREKKTIGNDGAESDTGADLVNCEAFVSANRQVFSVAACRTLLREYDALLKENNN